MGYFYNPEIILGEKFATNLHTKFCWKWKLTNQVKHYSKRYNACFLYLIHVESKKIIKQVCVLKQTNKLCACVRKTLCLCAEKAWNSFLFQSRKPSMINKFTEERYFVQLSLLSCFCTPSICPFLLKVGVFSQGFRWIKALTEKHTQLVFRAGIAGLRVERGDSLPRCLLMVPCRNYNEWE